MKTTIKHLPKNTVELLIELPEHLVRPHLDRAAERLSKQRPQPGFRPGKAPYGVMEKAVGADVIYHEAAENIIRATYPKAVAEHKLQTVGAPSIELQKLAPNNPFIYKAVVALLPDIKLGDYRALKLKKTAVTVGDDEVNKVMEDVRRSRGKEALVQRPAIMGDKVELDFKGFRDNIPVEGASSSMHPVTIGSGHFVPGFEEQLVGLAANDKKEFVVRFPKDYKEKSLANQDVTFKVSCHAVYEVTLPALDDEFAKSLGSYPTLQALRERLRKNLEEEKRHKERERFENAMLEKIAGLSTFGEFPDQLVDGEVEKMLEELRHSIDHQGMSFANYLESIKKTVEQLKKEFRPQAEKRLRLALVTRAVAEQEKITVGDDVVQKEIDASKRLYQGNTEIEANLTSPEYFRYLKNTLTQKRVLEFLDEMMGAEEAATKK